MGTATFEVVVVMAVDWLYVQYFRGHGVKSKDPSLIVSSCVILSLGRCVLFCGCATEFSDEKWQLQEYYLQLNI